MQSLETTDKGIQFLLKKILKYQKLIKKLKSDLELEKLKTNSCSCHNFSQHKFKEDDLTCIKVPPIFYNFYYKFIPSVCKKILEIKCVPFDLYKNFTF